MLATLLAAVVAATSVQAVVRNDQYIWNSVKIGGGGGFVPNIIFNTAERNLAYARTDIGGAYRWNHQDDSWLPLLDFANDTNWNYWGADALATDPVQPENLYIAVGLYTNSWDPRNGTILKSRDRGESFRAIPLPFKVGGNMPGRGLGERLAIDPNNNKILYFGARSGNGLWRSTDAGLTWNKVANFPDVGTYVQNPSDSSGYGSDIMGIAWITFDPSAKNGQGTRRIFVGVASLGTDNIFVSEDNGATWAALAGQNNANIPHHAVLSAAERALYIPYVNAIGPYDGTGGSLQKYFIDNNTWVDITPAQVKADGNYGLSGLAIDPQRPGTVMVAPLNQWYPDANILRSVDGGASWTPIYTFGYPPPDWQLTVYPNYNYDVSRASWISTFQTGDSKKVGWMIQGLSINPFDSDHWLYGTGLTIFGGHDLTNWDKSPRQNITLASLADGIEETAVLGLTAPPTGPKLISAVGDIGGFVHTDVTQVPKTFTNPIWSGTVADVDHAGAAPQNIVRLAQMSGSSAVQVATSSDGGVTWAPYPGAPDPSVNAYGGKIAISALGDALLWSQATNLPGVQFSKNGSAFAPAAGVPAGATIASDKLNNTVFYAGSGNQLFISTDSGANFRVASVLGSATSIREIAVSPFKAGELYVSTNRGVWYTNTYGRSFAGLPEATEAWSLAVGAPKKRGGTPALYAAATVGGVNSLYRTEDSGRTWYKLPTPQKALSSASAMVLAADPNVYSQIFVGTNGRGIFVGHS